MVSWSRVLSPPATHITRISIIWTTSRPRVRLVGFRSWSSRLVRSQSAHIIEKTSRTQTAVHPVGLLENACDSTTIPAANTRS